MGGQKYNPADEWDTAMFLYRSALKQINTKIEILNDEFVQVHHYTPIEHVKARIKTPESIVKKLKKMGKEVNIENMVAHLNDIAGVRIICSFSSDIEQIADMISNQKDVTVHIIKNYIANPKPNGYKSYHMVVSIPVYLSDGPVETRVEIQIRTIAMDFWASLEHKIYYKFEGQAPMSIRQELKECADIIEQLDQKMLGLNDLVRRVELEKEEEKKQKVRMQEDEKQRLKEKIEKVIG